MGQYSHIAFQVIPSNSAYCLHMYMCFKCIYHTFYFRTPAEYKRVKKTRLGWGYLEVNY